MTEEDHCCVYERVARVEFRNLREDLLEVKSRVGQLEKFVIHGLVLMLANLAAVGVVLVERLLQ